MWGDAFGGAWGESFIAGDAAPEAPLAAPVPPVYGFGSGRGRWNRPAPERAPYAPSLHSDDEEQEMATIAAFVIGIINA